MFPNVVSLKQAASLCAAAYRAAWIAGVSSALTTSSIDALCIGAARWAATSIRNCMLHNALVFLIAAFITGVFGFTGLAGTPLGVAQGFCGVFASLCVLSLFMLRRDSARGLQ
jgi:uncharacterized membrane protein YtjA (UPF0391 family)